MEITLERLLEYLEQYDPDTVVFLTNDDAQDSGCRDSDYVILEDALAEIIYQLRA